MKVDMYTDVSFTCESDGNTRWKFEGGYVPHNAKQINRNTLKIHKVKLINCGVYECRGSYNYHEVYFAARAHLKVFGK